MRFGGALEVGVSSCTEETHTQKERKRERDTQVTTHTDKVQRGEEENAHGTREGKH